MSKPFDSVEDSSAAFCVLLMPAYRGNRAQSAAA